MIGSWTFKGSCNDLTFFTNTGAQQLTAVGSNGGNVSGLESKIEYLEKENEALRKAIAQLKVLNKSQEDVELAATPSSSTSTGVAVAATAVIVGGTAFALHKKQ